MITLDLYKGILFELNKVQAPDFDVDDFNHFMPMATDQWLKNELDQFELTQKVSDKISCLVKSTSPIVLNADNTTDVRLVTLPEDYRHLVNCLVGLRYKAVTPSYAVNALRSAYTKRYTGDSQANIMDNYYLRPLVTDADARLYHRTIGNKLSILIDTPVHPSATVVIKDVILEYITKPPAMTLGQDYSVVVDTVFPDHANREIVKVCAALFLEDSESSRLQSFIAVNS